ncbi:UxaA family hydrolase [Caulobacter sp. DWP3-1-3b2]|uniref:UxaA family hydrolase n=1 Tax=Caulobacter sp. DWP3-1-3b2 TaxID=2804643 RepID=UPI003CE9B1E5
MSAAAIHLHESDNVVVCCRSVKAGEILRIGQFELAVSQDVELGHKLAFVALEPGDKVVKYGMPIGSMTIAVAPGDWVHMHNMKSDYLSAHTRTASGDRE